MNEFISRVGIFYWFTWQWLRGFFNIYHRIDVTGAGNVPNAGGGILASNHLSHWDSFAIGCSIRRRIKFVADKKMYKRAFFSWFLNSIGGVQLTRGEHKGSEMISDAIDVIKQGSMLLIYPEGMRSRSGVPGRSRTGMLVMAAQTGAPIIPCRISGTSAALPVKGRFLKPAKITVSYGKPIRFEPGEIDLDDREKLMRQSEIVLDTILSLPGTFPKNAAMTEEGWWSDRRKESQDKDE